MEQAMANDSGRTDKQRISSAKAYCEGYAYGAWVARDDDVDLESENVDGNPSYRAGFARGVAAANRIRTGTMAEEENRKEIIHRIERLDDPQMGRLTEEELSCWKSLQASVRANGEKDWQNMLLELFRNLSAFRELTKLATDDEKRATDLTQAAVINALARTSLVLPDDSEDEDSVESDEKC
jgi:hypothetical protein